MTQGRSIRLIDEGDTFDRLKHAVTLGDELEMYRHPQESVVFVTNACVTHFPVDCRLFAGLRGQTDSANTGPSDFICTGWCINTDWQRDAFCLVCFEARCANYSGNQLCKLLLADPRCSYTGIGNAGTQILNNLTAFDCLKTNGSKSQVSELNFNKKLSSSQKRKSTLSLMKLSTPMQARSLVRNSCALCRG